MALKEEQTPLVSVILPIYNAEVYLRRCLTSIESQTCGNLEVLMVNDGSTDGSGGIAEEFAAKDGRFRLFSQENQGVSAARNAALPHARGKYLLFVDSDDEISPDYAQRLLDNAGERRLVICDYHQKSALTGEEMEHFTVLAGEYTKKDYIRRLARCPGAHYLGVLWNKLYLRAIVEEHGLRFAEDLSLGEDFVFNMAYLSYVDEVRCLPCQSYVYYWQQQNSLTHAKMDERAAAERTNRLYGAYCELYRREGLDKIWGFWMRFYMVKHYYEMLNQYGEEAERWQPLFYQRFIRDNGISRGQFLIYDGIKRAKKLLKR